MAKIDCAEVTNYTDEAINARNFAQEADVREAVTRILGTEDEIRYILGSDNKLAAKAMSSWKSAFENLVNHILKNKRISSSTKERDYLDMLLDYLQKKLGMPVGRASLIATGNPTRIIAVSVLINKLINLHNTRFGKKLNVYERALLPTTLFGMRSDPFGSIYRYLKKAVNLTEDSRHMYSLFESKYNKIMDKRIRGIRNSIAQLLQKTGGVITPDMIYSNTKIESLDDIDVDNENINEEGISGVYTVDNREVTYFGTIKKNDGTIVHLVIDNATNQKVELPENIIPRSTLEDKLVDKYANEMTNDVMNGQMRYIRWADSPISKEHKEEISKILNKIKTKVEKGEGELSKGMADVHFTEVGGITFRYVILKKGGLDRDKETHYAYIISHEANGEKVNYFSKNQEELKKRIKVSEATKIKSANPFREGWYKSTVYRSYGSKYWEKDNDTRGLIEDSVETGWDFSRLNLSYLSTQPNSLLTSAYTDPSTPGARGVQTYNIWDTISRLRTLLNLVGNDMQLRAAKEQSELEKRLDPKGKFAKSLSRYMKVKDVETMLEAVKQLYGVSSRIYVDEKGNLHSPNSHFQMMKDGYFPTIYDRNTVDDMLDNTIDNLKLRLSEITDDKQRAELELLIKQFELTRARRYPEHLEDEISMLETELGIDKSGTSNAILADRVVNMKHRSSWTDLSLRRRDGDVIRDYLKRTYYSIAKNQLMVEMLDTIENIIVLNKGEFSRDVTDYMIERTKTAFHNPTAFAGFKDLPLVGTINYSYENLAKKLNKILPGSRNWNAKDLQHLVTWSKGLISGAVLGYGTALTNRTQIINPFIRYGMDIMKRASRMLRDKDTAQMAEAIIQHTGIDEVVNMVMDALASGSQITRKDAGLLSVPGLPLQIPTAAFRDFLLMLKDNRPGFVEKGIPEINMALNRIEVERINRIKNETQRYEEKKRLLEKALDNKRITRTQFKTRLFAYEKEIKRLNSEPQKRNVRKLRELYLDLIMTPKDDRNRKIIEAKFKAILGDVTDNRLRRMVSWKLSWWWDSAAPELFTVTEGERAMRKHGAIAAILHAADAKLLGSSSGKTIPVEIKNKVTGLVEIVNVPDIYMSDEAVRIARNAVNEMFFGMSPIHLPESMAGLGQQIFLYKGYPLNQMLHDYNVWEGFMAGSDYGRSHEKWMNMVARLIKEGIAASNRAWNGIPVDPSNKEIDTEALAMLRFLGVRVGMSLFTIGTELVGILKYIIRTPLSRQLSGMIRGGENPILGIALRLLINGLLMSMADDDELFEGNLPEIGWDIARLLLPVFFTLPANLIYMALED